MFLTTAQVAAELKIPVGRVSQMARLKQIPGINVSYGKSRNTWRFNQRAFREWKQVQSDANNLPLPNRKWFPIPFPQQQVLPINGDEPTVPGVLAYKPTGLTAIMERLDRIDQKLDQLLAGMAIWEPKP